MAEPALSESTAAKSPDGDDAFFQTARRRFDEICEDEGDNRQAGVEDLKFKNGEQWPASIKAERENDARPCLTVNKMKTFVHQVTNAQRENRPAIFVNPIGDKADVQTAKMLRGMIRHIERRCDAEIAYDTAFDGAASNGWGYWRILTQYQSADSFNQEVAIQRIKNPFTVYMGPCNDPCGADAPYCFVTEMVSREDFKRKWPNVIPLDWDATSIGENYRNWVTETHIRVAEYYVVETKKRRLIGLSNGFVGFWDELAPEVKEQLKASPATIVNDREAEDKTVKCYKIDGKSILEQYDWLGKWIPIVRVIGDEVDVEGHTTYSGIIRDAKDSQRMYNYWVTSETELIALAPKAPFVMAEGQEEGHEMRWKQANRKLFPYLLYKQTDAAGKPAPPPRREPMPQIPSGMVNAKLSAAQDMMATTGIRFDATKNERTQDESGVALAHLRQNTDLGAYHYIDNLGRALRHTGRQIIDLIPKVYDTQQVITILREDDSEERVKIDPKQGAAYQKAEHGGKPIKSFNPNVGQYDVTVTIGPNYATKRMEASDSMMNFAKAFPNKADFVADLVAKNQDWEGAETISQRLAMTLPPEMLQPDDSDLSPQVQALIRAQQMQIKKLTDGAQQLGQALQSRDLEHARDIYKIESEHEDRQRKTSVDYETAMAKVMADMEGKLLDHVGARFAEMMGMIKVSLPPEEDVAVPGAAQQPPPLAGNGAMAPPLGA